MGIPVEDLGQKSDQSPRKLRLIDDSHGEIILNLWKEDANNMSAIEQIMNRPVRIKQGPVHSYNGLFEVSERLTSIGTELSSPRMKSLQAWFNSLKE